MFTVTLINLTAGIQSSSTTSTAKSTHSVNANDEENPRNWREYLNFTVLINDGESFSLNIAVGKFTPDSRLLLLNVMDRKSVISVTVDVFRSLAWNLSI